MKKNKVKQIAEKEYHKHLKDIENIIGTGITDSNQLNKLGKRLFGNKYKGTYPADKIPSLRRKQMMIVNNEKSNESGEHWLAIIKNIDDTILIYDSFARKHFKILPSLAESTEHPIKNTERDAEQSKSEQNCGARCMAFLKVFNELGYQYAIWI
jgi:hypothetical protein